MTFLARLRDIGKDSSIYGLSQVLSQLIGFLLLPLYTSYFSPTDYGVLAMLSLIPLVLPPIVNLGLNNAVFRYYSQCKTSDERDTLVGTAHVLIVVTSSIVFSLLALFSSPLSKELTDSNQYLLSFNLTLLSAWFTTISTIPMVVLKQQRKVKQIAFRSLLSLLLNVVTTLLFVVFFKWGVLGSVIGNVIGSASSAILVTIIVSYRTWTSFARVKVRELLDFSLPFIPYFLQAVAMGFVGQYLIKEQVSMKDAGFYSIAVRFSLPIAIVLNAVNSSWAGYKFDIRQNDLDPKKTYRDIFSVYTLLVALFWLMISLWMPLVLRLILDTNFYEAGDFIPIVALIPILQNLRGMLTTGFEMSKKPRWIFLLTSVGLMALALSAFILVDYFGALGVAASVVCGWAMTGVATYIYSQKVYPINYNVGLLLAVTIVTFCVYWTPLNFISSELLVLILKSIAGSFALFMLYLLLERKGERQFIFKWFRL